MESVKNAKAMILRWKYTPGKSPGASLRGIVNMCDIPYRICRGAFGGAMCATYRTVSYGKRHLWDCGPLPDGAQPGARGERALSELERFVAELAAWANNHDWHLPHAGGPPAKGQSCAKGGDLGEGEEPVEQFYCSKLFPRSVVERAKERVEEDPHRAHLFRLWLARNCNFINN